MRSWIWGAGVALWVGCSGGGTRAAESLERPESEPEQASEPAPAPPPIGHANPRDVCLGVTLPREMTVQEHVVPYQVMNDFDCGSGTADGSGHLVLPVLWAHGTGLEVVRAADGASQHASTVGWGATLYRQPEGVFSLSLPYLGPCGGQPVVEGWTLSGTPTAEGQPVSGEAYAAAEDPHGGLLLAGNLEPGRCGAVAPQARALMFERGAPGLTRWGPVALASKGTVFGAGVDTEGRSLVITDGTAAFGEGAISAQWFERDGTARTGEFLLVDDFVPGPSTWFEAAPRMGGGLFVVRVDSRLDGTPRLVRTPLLALGSGETAPAPVPGWLARRAGTRLQLLPGERGYAVLPDGANNVHCAQTLEVVAADGTVCGSREYPIADGTCDTLDLTLGADGTVIQQLPTEMESFDMYRTFHSCTWRWWNGALR